MEAECDAGASIETDRAGTGVGRESALSTNGGVMVSTGRMRLAFLAAAVGVCGPAGAARGQLSVAEVSPAARSLTGEVNSSISVTFDRAVDRATVTNPGSFWAFGRWSGTVLGNVSFSDGDRTITLTPNRPLSAGENVMVILSDAIAGADASSMQTGGYSFQFWVRTNPSPMSFAEVQRLETDRNDGSRAYGGFASDLNEDGYPDITIVNEDTSDLRVFLNLGAGDARVDGFLLPTTPVGNRASPSEPSDFNRDGHVDVCVVNIDDATVSVLLGNGDGTFAPQQLLNVGSLPRGVAVLDIDGDGDTDIVNTNSGANGSAGNLSVLENDGNGVFSVVDTIEANLLNEWALAAADMNQDGRLDLVVGGRDAQALSVMGGNGDGTFSQIGSIGGVGFVWMLVLGDVDGNGTEDVSTASSNNNRGVIVRGDGMGGFAAPELYVTDAFPLATDLGDTDGDGDLDWLTSSFSGDWRLYENDGTGSFSFAEEFPAPAAASCTLFVDLDNDRDLDVALIDEIADEVIIMQNSGGVQIPAASVWGLASLLLGVLSAASILLRGGR